MRRFCKIAQDIQTGDRTFVDVPFEGTGSWSIAVASGPPTGQSIQMDRETYNQNHLSTCDRLTYLIHAVTPPPSPSNPQRGKQFQ